MKIMHFTLYSGGHKGTEAEFGKTRGGLGDSGG